MLVCRGCAARERASSAVGQRSRSPLPHRDHDLLAKIISTLPSRLSTAFKQLEQGPTLSVSVEFALRRKPVAFQDAPELGREIGGGDPLQNYRSLEKSGIRRPWCVLQGAVVNGGGGGQWCRSRSSSRQPSPIKERTGILRARSSGMTGVIRAVPLGNIPYPIARPSGQQHAPRGYKFVRTRHCRNPAGVEQCPHLARDEAVRTQPAPVR